mgnify:CR=1 FL=1
MRVPDRLHFIISRRINLIISYIRAYCNVKKNKKTKEKTFEESIKIAKKRDATVLVQNTDGTFSTGFKPR